MIMEDHLLSAFHAVPVNVEGERIMITLTLQNTWEDQIIEMKLIKMGSKLTRHIRNWRPVKVETLYLTKFDRHVFMFTVQVQMRD